jgi:N6-adenosine-specific RNA methylase IME4
MAPDRITNNIDDLPRNHYKCIVSDPAWQYRSKKTGGSMTSGAAQKYATLSLDELSDLPVKEIAAKDAVLFLWITTPLKEDIFTSGLIKKWGFSYKTSLYWIKNDDKLGLGYWWRGTVEEVAFCVRGKVTAFREPTTNIFFAPKRGHSEKPPAFWDKIEPTIERWWLNPKLEMFARTPRAGWDSFGLEVKETL